MCNIQVYYVDIDIDCYYDIRLTCATVISRTPISTCAGVTESSID